MQRTQIKDCLKNIWRQKVSFLSVIIITVLGVTAFLGIDYAAASVRQNASDLYNRMNFRDVEVVSTLLFSEEDLSDLRAVEGVKDAEAVRYTNAKVTVGEQRLNVGVISMTERINRPDIVDGRMPENPSECAVESFFVEQTGVRIGDSVDLLNASGGTADYLLASRYTVTGIVNHPDHVSRSVSTSAYFLVTWDAFDDGALNHCYMKTEITIDKPADVNRLSDDYADRVSAVCKRIQDLAVTATLRRDDNATKDAREQLASAKDQLADGYQQIEDAKQLMRDQMREAYEAAFPGEKEQALVRWETKKIADVNDPNETAKYFWITDSIRLDLSRDSKEVFGALLTSELFPKQLLVSLYPTILKKSVPFLNETATLLEEKYDLKAIRDKLIESTTASSGEYQQLADACMAWDEGHEKYIAGLAAYEAAVSELDPCQWIVFDGQGNASFVQIDVVSNNFLSLKMTFSLLFTLVGMLVIFATVGKMVDEQRSLIGTTKALGFFKSEIFLKYLIFGVSATLIGGLFGILIARFAIAPFLLSALNRYYLYDLSMPRFYVLPAIVVCIAGVLLAVASIWFACAKLLREPAIRLMQSKAPEMKHKYGGRSGLSLYSRLILLNMRTDLKRVIVTIVSVAGCCALIVIGFTLRSAVTNTSALQYGKIVDYDLWMQYDPMASETAESDLQTLLDQEGTEYVKVYRTDLTYHINGDIQFGEVLSGDLKEIGKFYHLRDWQTEEPFESARDGVLIQRRVAEIYGLDVNSAFEIAVGGTKPAIVRVAGVYENYLDRTVVMSNEYYRRIYGEVPENNTFFIRLGEADETHLSESALKINGYESITRADSDRMVLDTAMSTVNIVVVLLIFIAGVMAGVVLLNLTNMYIMQKKRELTIMRINGFTVKEVIRYVLRETVITTIMGIVFGIASGTGIAYVIVRKLEQPFLHLDRSINVIAWLIAAAITVLFTVIVNCFALRPVRDLKLNDVA